MLKGTLMTDPVCEINDCGDKETEETWKGPSDSNKPVF